MKTEEQNDDNPVCLHKHSSLTIAERKRKEAQFERHAKARGSIKVWPITVKQDEQPEQCVRRFFILEMKVQQTSQEKLRLNPLKRWYKGTRDPRSTMSSLLHSGRLKPGIL